LARNKNVRILKDQKEAWPIQKDIAFFVGAEYFKAALQKLEMNLLKRCLFEV